MLDIYIFGPQAFCMSAPKKSFVRRANEYVCSFDNEGYYWLLYPMLKDLAEQTGQLIDLYGLAIFADDALDALEQTLIAAHALVDAQPDVWHVRTGIRMKPLPVSEIHSEVDKQQMNAWLESIEVEVHKAKIAGNYVVFYGD